MSTRSSSSTTQYEPYSHPNSARTVSRAALTASSSLRASLTLRTTSLIAAMSLSVSRRRSACTTRSSAWEKILPTAESTVSRTGPGVRFGSAMKSIVPTTTPSWYSGMATADRTPLREATGARTQSVTVARSSVKMSWPCAQARPARPTPLGKDASSVTRRNSGPTSPDSDRHVRTSCPGSIHHTEAYCMWNASRTMSMALRSTSSVDVAFDVRSATFSSALT